MSAKDATGLVIGGEPRIDFLPPEVKAGKQARKTRRSLIGLVIIVLVACAGGYVFATSLAVQSQAALVAEQARTQSLLTEQAKYAEARTAANQLAAARDARLVGTASEILWKAYLEELNATLPAGMVITVASIDSASATEQRPAPSVPLQGDSVATLSVTAIAPTLPLIADWVDNLQALRGFADVWVSPAQLEDAGYQVEIRLNVNSEALEKRFFEGYGSEPAADSEDETSIETDDAATEGEG